MWCTVLFHSSVPGLLHACLGRVPLSPIAFGKIAAIEAETYVKERRRENLLSVPENWWIWISHRTVKKTCRGCPVKQKSGQDGNHPKRSEGLEVKQSQGLAVQHLTPPGHKNVSLIHWFGLIHRDTGRTGTQLHYFLQASVLQCLLYLFSFTYDTLTETSGLIHHTVVLS